MCTFCFLFFCEAAGEVNWSAGAAATILDDGGLTEMHSGT